MKLSVYGRFHARSLLTSQHFRITHFFSSIAPDKLYKRISGIGHHSISVRPILDEWVTEGNPVTQSELKRIIKELIIYKRFKHALGVSCWMSDKTYTSPSRREIATRMNLIYRVRGIEEVQNYFNNLHQDLKGFEVYTALLNCYAHEKDVEKAEATFKKLMDIENTRSPTVFNILMNLYCQIGNIEKLLALISEMESKGILFDKYTFGIHFTACAANSDIEEMNKIVEKMESNWLVVLDWHFYSIAADGYLKTGVVVKAIAMLKELEGRITDKTKSIAFDTLLKLYARTGNKDEVHRIWKVYKKRDKIYNKGYMSMISSLLTLDDVKAAEKIFEEWESMKLCYDFRVPNLLINAYCKKSLLKKAESLIDHAVSKGSEPSVDAWLSLANGYLADNQIPMAREAMKKAISVCPHGWQTRKEILASCLEYLEGKGDQSKAEELVELLRADTIFSLVVHDRLLTYIKGGKLQSDAPL